MCIILVGWCLNGILRLLKREGLNKRRFSIVGFLLYVDEMKEGPRIAMTQSQCVHGRVDVL